MTAKTIGSWACFLGLQAKIQNRNPKCYSMTLSARASSLGGIVRPICLAAFQVDHHLKLHRLFDGNGGLVALCHESSRV
jgi:hypothetical protein